MPDSSRSRARAIAVSSRLPPPMLPQVPSDATTILAPASRGAWPRTSVTVTRTPARRSVRSRVSARQPVPVSPTVRRGHHALPRARSSAQKTASGVAGDASSTLVPGGPNAAAASRSASRTASASISGGSPTAFDP